MHSVGPCVGGGKTRVTSNGVPYGDGMERRYTNTYYILLIIGLIPFFLSFALYGMACLWVRLTEVVDNGKKQAKHSIGGIHLPFMCEDCEKARLLLLRGLKESTPFFGVVYTNVCSMTFASFSCMPLRSGMQVLIAAPQVVCYEYEHNVLVGISILSLIVYVLGIPAIILGVTVYAKLNNKFVDRAWLIVAGIFYREYGTRPQPVVERGNWIEIWVVARTHDAAMPQSLHTTGGSSSSACASSPCLFARSRFADFSRLRRCAYFASSARMSNDGLPSCLLRYGFSIAGRRNPDHRFLHAFPICVLPLLGQTSELA